MLPSGTQADSQYFLLSGATAQALLLLSLFLLLFLRRLSSFLLWDNILHLKGLHIKIKLILHLKKACLLLFLRSKVLQVFQNVTLFYDIYRTCNTCNTVTLFLTYTIYIFVY